MDGKKQSSGNNPEIDKSIEDRIVVKPPMCLPKEEKLPRILEVIGLDGTVLVKADEKESENIPSHEEP